jgi:hypothetical protein
MGLFFGVVVNAESAVAVSASESTSVRNSEVVFVSDTPPEFESLVSFYSYPVFPFVELGQWYTVSAIAWNRDAVRSLRLSNLNSIVFKHNLESNFLGTRITEVLEGQRHAIVVVVDSGFGLRRNDGGIKKHSSTLRIFQGLFGNLGTCLGRVRGCFCGPHSVKQQPTLQETHNYQEPAENKVRAISPVFRNGHGTHLYGVLFLLFGYMTTGGLLIVGCEASWRGNRRIGILSISLGICVDLVVSMCGFLGYFPFG